MKALNALSIRGRLISIALLSLLSVLFLGNLFVGQSLKDVDFARKEIAGNAIVAPLLSDLVDAVSGGQTPSEQTLAAIKQNGAAAGVSTDGTFVTGASPRDALASAITDVGNSSNLILDPDLDSFYVMDALLTKLTDAIGHAANVVESYKSVAYAQTISQQDQINLVAQVGGLEGALEGLENSIASASRGNPDESLATLAPAANDLKVQGAALTYVVGEYITILGRSATPPDMTSLDQAQVAFLKATKAFAAAGVVELDHLLQTRIGGLLTRLALALAAAVGLVGFAFFVTWLFARGILGHVHQLEADIRGLADERPGVIIRALKRRDELSAIARAVEYLQDRTVARLREAAAIQQSERQRTEALEHKAAQDREESLKAAAEQGRKQGLLVSALSDALERLSAGDLDCQVQGSFDGDFAVVRDRFNATIEKLRGLIGRIKQTSGTMREATSEILAGANDLSMRTSKQAATIQETNQVIAGLSTAVAANAERSSKGSDLAKWVTETAAEGTKIMTEARTAMELIQQSSGKISEIIGLIDDIAFQTNLLALNASVEAARAGQAGAGFAVVAVEVRRLAQSTAEASSSVKQLIQASSTEVRTGASLVTRASDALAKVLSIASETREIMTQIASDARRQSADISEVKSAMQQMDESTQHNAALVEETNAAIEQTEHEASQLDETVSVFRMAG